jgi:MarR family 2-MHQ and catechol resistance regulon transcriptional repressor
VALLRQREVLSIHVSEDFARHHAKRSEGPGFSRPLTPTKGKLYFDIETFHADRMPTHYKGTPQEILALDAFIKLARSINAVQAEIIPALQKDFGLTESQFAVLEALHHLGPLSQGQLCHKILRSGSNVTTVVDNLERDELVRRERDNDDRRVQVVSLTQKGRTAVTRALPVHIGRITELMGALTAAEQKELGRICRKLGTSISN